MREILIHLSYFTAAALFILGLRNLTRPGTARRGMRQAAAGMLFAILGTLVNSQVLEFRWIVVGMATGAVAGYPLAMWMPMTAMPQRLAMALTLASFAATLVGVAEYLTHVSMAEGLAHTKAMALVFQVLLGSITVAGALVAAGKLKQWLPSRPLTYRAQDLVNVMWLAFSAGLGAFIVLHPDAVTVFYTMIAFALVFGAMVALPVDAADMPVMIALLNASAGISACALGFAIDNIMLIVAGALSAASGLSLSLLMSRATGRSLSQVLSGAFRTTVTAAGTARRDVKTIGIREAALQIARASQVIVVPGYGLAVAKAQHVLREFAELLEQRGAEVKFAIHPVAGRMPGHMNVLLAEARTPRDKLYDIGEINDEFERADVVLVIGANDVVNPAARTDESSPIHGMPILDADRARSIIVIKRSMATGFAGIENELFHGPNTSMLFGDAKATLTALTEAVQRA